MDNYMYLVPVAAVVALLFAAYLANKVSKMDAGTDRMKEIADAIAEGARAFLGAEYKILVIFVVVLFVLIGVGIQNWIEAICFVVGALFSTIAGYCLSLIHIYAGTVRSGNVFRIVCSILLYAGMLPILERDKRKRYQLCFRCGTFR